MQSVSSQRERKGRQSSKVQIGLVALARNHLIWFLTCTCLCSVYCISTAYWAIFCARIMPISQPHTLGNSSLLESTHSCFQTHPPSHTIPHPPRDSEDIAVAQPSFHPSFEQRWIGMKGRTQLSGPYDTSQAVVSWQRLLVCMHAKWLARQYCLLRTNRSLPTQHIPLPTHHSANRRATTIMCAARYPTEPPNFNEPSFEQKK